MRKLSFVTVIIVFLLIISNGVQAQTTQTQLDQLKLMEKFVGTWQRDKNYDSIAVKEFQQYGKAFVETDYLLFNGEKSFQSISSYSFSSEDGKFKMFRLVKNGSYTTWISSFTAGNKLDNNQVTNFNPKSIWWVTEIVLDTPTNMTVTDFVLGAKHNVDKFSKVK